MLSNASSWMSMEAGDLSVAGVFGLTAACSAECASVHARSGGKRPDQVCGEELPQKLAGQVLPPGSILYKTQMCISIRVHVLFVLV